MRRQSQRIVLSLLLSLVLLTLFAISATASTLEESEGVLDQAMESLTELLPKGAPVPNDPEALSEGVGIRAVWKTLADAVMGERSEAVSFFLYVFGVAVLMAIANLLCAGLTHGAAVQRAILAVLAVSVYERLSLAFSQVKEGLVELSSFFGGIVPIMTTLTLAGGGESSGAAGALGMSITLKLIETLATSVLLPIVSMIFAVTLVGAIGEDGGIGALSIGIKRLFLWVLGIVTTLTGAAFALQTVITAAQDSTAMRALKYTASGMIPIVGSTVSGALSTLAAGVSYMKSVVGVSSIVGIFLLMLPSLTRLFLYRFSLDVCAIFLDFCGAAGAGKTLSAFRSALDSMIAVMALSGTLLIFEIVMFMKCGVALL